MYHNMYKSIFYLHDFTVKLNSYCSCTHLLLSSCAPIRKKLLLNGNIQHSIEALLLNKFCQSVWMSLMNMFSAQSQSIAHTSVSIEMFVTGLKIFYIYENCVSSHDHSPVVQRSNWWPCILSMLIHGSPWVRVSLAEPDSHTRLGLGLKGC